MEGKQPQKVDELMGQAVVAVLDRICKLAQGDGTWTCAMIGSVGDGWHVR